MTIKVIRDTDLSTDKFFVDSQTKVNIADEPTDLEQFDVYPTLAYPIHKLVQKINQKVPELVIKPNLNEFLNTTEDVNLSYSGLPNEIFNLQLADESLPYIEFVNKIPYIKPFYKINKKTSAVSTVGYKLGFFNVSSIGASANPYTELEEPKYESYMPEYLFIKSQSLSSKHRSELLKARTSFNLSEVGLKHNDLLSESYVYVGVNGIPLVPNVETNFTIKVKPFLEHIPNTVVGDGTYNYSVSTIALNHIDRFSTKLGYASDISKIPYILVDANITPEKAGQVSDLPLIGKVAVYAPNLVNKGVEGSPY